MLSYGGWNTLRLTVLDVRTRSYFGVYTIGSTPDGYATMLTHGTTLHGVQSRMPGAELAPTSYFAPGSGVAHFLSAERKSVVSGKMVSVRLILVGRRIIK